MKHLGAPLLQDHLTRSAERAPGKVCLVTRGVRYTYREVDVAARALGATLVAAGVERGDRVIAFCENGFEAVVAFWGALHANAIAVPVHPQTRPEKLTHLLHDSRAAALVTEAPLARTFGTPAAEAASLKLTVVSGELPTEVRDEMRDVVSFRAATAPAPGDAPRRSIDVDLAAIIYTSGSTGEPKGVMLTHRNMLAATASITSYLENVSDDVILSALPLSFDYGLYQMIMAFAFGGRLILERSFAYPAKVLTRIPEEHVTGFPGVPTMFAMIGDSARGLDLRSVRYVTNTAAALPEKYIGRIQELFPSAKVFSMYGLTECKRCTYLPPEDLARKPGSVGIPIPNTEAWILDDRGFELPRGTVGQLVIRGATVMAGYWEKPEATAERLRPGPVPGERLLWTGDLCTMDEDGYVTFVARMDDVIKCRGEKVAPKEVEAVLLSIEGVKEAVVVGVPDDVAGHTPKAYVVLEDGAQVAATDLRRICQERLEPHMVPTKFAFLPALPRSANGKIDKSALP